MGENIHKWCDQQGISLQNLQTVHAAQYPKKKKKPNQKVGRKPKQTFLQRRHTDGQEAHEKCSTSLIVREMQMKTKISSHSNQNGHHQKIYEQ